MSVDVVQRAGRGSRRFRAVDTRVGRSPCLLCSVCLPEQSMFRDLMISRAWSHADYIENFAGPSRTNIRILQP